MGSATQGPLIDCHECPACNIAFVGAWGTHSLNPSARTQSPLRCLPPSWVWCGHGSLEEVLWVTVSLVWRPGWVRSCCVPSCHTPWPDPSGPGALLLHCPACSSCVFCFIYTSVSPISWRCSFPPIRYWEVFTEWDVEWRRGNGDTGWNRKWQNCPN